MAIDDPQFPTLTPDQVAAFFGGENDDDSRPLLGILDRYYERHVPIDLATPSNFRARWYREIIPARRDRAANDCAELS